MYFLLECNELWHNLCDSEVLGNRLDVLSSMHSWKLN